MRLKVAVALCHQPLLESTQYREKPYLDSFEVALFSSDVERRVVCIIGQGGQPSSDVIVVAENECLKAGGMRKTNISNTSSNMAYRILDNG